MLCNCGHKVKDHEDHYQCRLCPCPIVVMVTYKEAAEWKIFKREKLENVSWESVNNYES